MHSVLWLFPKLAAAIFAVAGFYFFADPAPLAKLLGDWANGRNFNRVLGVMSLLSAAFLAVSQLRPWGVTIAGVVLFGLTVALLERRKYVQALPGIVLLGALPLTLAFS